MKYPPRINYIESFQRFQVVSIERRAFFDSPIAVVIEIASPKFLRAGNRMRIVIKRMNARAQTPCRQTEQPAAGTDVQKTLSLEVLNFQHLLERFFRARDAPIVKQREKSAPVLAELEAFIAGNFDCVRTH